eukprot:TRINITY_DN2580_c0_g1_i2.p1 TRINITY_DN2580_c0_g1~~TRINITY_DN2580_c0_g1_i2.p1  ORF type:complete len:415 (-),score=46.78 TRINITY_DN2580_c0_g1_i2:20-1264(-)
MNSHRALYITIQYDWLTSIQEGDPYFWCNFYHFTDKPVYGKIIINKKDKTSELLTLDQETVQTLGLFSSPKISFEPPTRTLTIHITPSQLFTFIGPQIVYSMRDKYKSINACAVADEQLICTAHPDSGLVVTQLQPNDSHQLYELKDKKLGHFGDVNTVQFFPSGKVLLSGGADTQLLIWSLVDNGYCAASLKGTHTQGISDTDIIERGRNVISASRDGNCVLWDVPTQKAIHVFSSYSPINCCRAITPKILFGQGGDLSQKDNREVGTEGKLLLLAKENRELDVYDFSSKNKVFGLRSRAAVNACAYLDNSSLLAFGDQDGYIYFYDVRQPSAPLSETTVESPILSLSQSLNPDNIWASTADGRVLSLSPQDTSCSMCLVGSDCEPIRISRSLGPCNYLVTSDRMGVIRKFSK